MIKIVSTRFNDVTWQENLDFRKNNNIKCIYGAPLELPPHIYLDTNVFVVEMNNSVNKITGIGLIRNKRYDKQSYRHIYGDILYITGFRYYCSVNMGSITRQVIKSTACKINVKESNKINKILFKTKYAIIYFFIQDIIIHYTIKMNYYRLCI